MTHFYGGFWRGTITLWRLLTDFQTPFRQGNKNYSNHHSTLSQEACWVEKCFFRPINISPPNPRAPTLVPEGRYTATADARCRGKAVFSAASSLWVNCTDFGICWVTFGYKVVAARSVSVPVKPVRAQKSNTGKAFLPRTPSGAAIPGWQGHGVSHPRACAGASEAETALLAL